MEPGRCACGCGGVTKLIAKTDRRQGRVKGQPNRFISGHENRGRRTDLAMLYTIEPTTGCWLWHGTTNDQGYGIAKNSAGVRQRAHRLLYERHIGPIPEGLELDHVCRCRHCVNPAHMEPVTKVVNMRRGSATRLSDAQVLQIRARAAGQTRTTALYREIAEEFGISWHHVSAIVRRRNCRVIEGENPCT